MLAWALNKRSNKICVLSIGCGLGKIGFDQDPVGGVEPLSIIPGEEALKDLIYVTEASITGNQEAANQNLKIRTQHSLGQEFSYRFQFDLPEDMYTDIDNTAPEFFEYLDSVAEEKFNDDLDKITQFLEHLRA